MWKSIIYKEWIKTRWFVILYAVLGLGFIAYLFLTVQRDLKFNNANSYWYSIIFLGASYFNTLKFIPLLGAVAISVAQYFPETLNKCIKLTFHLPLTENRALLMMMFYGSSCLALCYLIQVVILGAFSFIYFPSDIFITALITITPWYLAGFSSYYLTALIVLEPLWKYRLAYLIVAGIFLSIFFQSAATGTYAPIILPLTFFAIISSISLLFSGYRFRKGEM